MQFLGIKDLFSLVIGTVETLNTVFAGVLRYSYAIGRIILQYLQVVYILTAHCCDRIIIALRIIWDDFGIFILDIGDRLAFVKSEIDNLIILLYHSTWICSKFILDAALYVIHAFGFASLAVYGHLCNITRIILKIPTEFKQGIIVWGESVWLSLWLIPTGLNQACGAVAYLLQQCYTKVSVVIQNCLQDIAQIIDKVVHFWCDIPLESSIGLVFGASAILLLIKYRYILLQTFVASVIYTLRKTHSFARSICCMVSWILHFIWKGTENTILRLVTNQNQVTVPAEEHDLSEEEPEIDDEAVFETRTTRQLRKQLYEEQETKLCVVCQDKGRCIIILPCKHLCLCSDCCDAIKRQQGLCPICRQRIMRRIQVYL